MKKMLNAALLLALCLILTACVTTQHDGVYDNAPALAGEDANHVKSFTGTIASADSNLYNFSVNTLSGAKTIWHFTADEEEGLGEEVTLRCTLAEAKGGEVKLVLVAPDGAVTTLAEAGGKGEDDGFYSFTAGEGTYRVKLVGRGRARAAGTLEFSGGELGYL